jgi:peptidoglycan/LPS O-acetylase OafA/YrhL
MSEAAPRVSASGSSMSRIPALDGVRGLAILVVLVHNVASLQELGTSLPLKLFGAATAAGWAGVQLFFVLSGFLITGILLDALGSERFLRTFYLRRTLRIFPLYYAVVAVAIVLVPVFPGTERWAALADQNQKYYWTYTLNWFDAYGGAIPGLSHFWSLAVEEQFYLVWPLVVSVLAGRRLFWLCLAMIVSGPFIRLGMHVVGFPPLAISEFTFARWDALAAGALLVMMLRERRGREWLARNHGFIAVASMVAILILVAIQHSFQESDSRIQIFGQTPSIAVSAWLIYACVSATGSAANTARAAMSLRWLRFFGKYSYAIYVFHVPIHYVLLSRVYDFVNDGTTPERLLKLVGYVGLVGALSTLAALISWSLLEARFLRLKDRIAPHDSGMPSPAGLGG